MNLSQEESLAYLEGLQKRVEYEDSRLREWGWVETPQGWLEPNDRLLVHASDAYNWGVGRYLEKNGWRCLIEIRQTGRPEWDKPIDRWARYQSPTTKRVYSFLEAATISEQNWSEDIWPDGCCEFTRQLNQLIGPNFTGSIIKTWFARTPEKKLELVHDNHGDGPATPSQEDQAVA